MITNPNGTKRFQDSDLVHTSVFNTALDSFDKVAITANGVGITQNPQTIFSFTPSNLFNNNLSISFYLRISSNCTLSASINYTDSSGAQQFNILDNFYFSSPDSYAFSPVFISTTSQPVSMTVACSSTSSSAYVSTSVAYF